VHRALGNLEADLRGGLNGIIGVCTLDILISRWAGVVSFASTFGCGNVAIRPALFAFPFVTGHASIAL
jgi:hypothetical protein